MTREEQLEQEAYDHDVDIIEHYVFESSRLKGLYSDNVIALSKAINSKKEKCCILAEELGHHFTTVGDILNQNIDGNRKQEYRARLWAYDKQIGFLGIINAYEANCQSLYEMADYLDVTEEFLLEALQCYKSKYGLHTQVDNYIIYFEPCLAVMKMV